VGKEAIIGTPVKSAEESAPKRSFVLFPRKFFQALKQRVHDYDVRVKTIDSRG
jgi:hypothetical protein